jgi:hypothetical protein
VTESRETRRSLLHSATEQFLDHLEESEAVGADAQLGAVTIAAEIDGTLEGEPTTFPTFWCSNENRIWQRGFFEILADYLRIDE